MRLVQALAEGLPIFYGQVVTGVDYSDAGVVVHTAQQTFRGAALSSICHSLIQAPCQPPSPL